MKSLKDPNDLEAKSPTKMQIQDNFLMVLLIYTSLMAFSSLQEMFGIGESGWDSAGYKPQPLPF